MEEIEREDCTMYFMLEYEGNISQFWDSAIQYSLVPTLYHISFLQALPYLIQVAFKELDLLMQPLKMLEGVTTVVCQSGN